MPTEMWGHPLISLFPIMVLTKGYVALLNGSLYLYMNSFFQDEIQVSLQHIQGGVLNHLRIAPSQLHLVVWGIVKVF